MLPRFRRVAGRNGRKTRSNRNDLRPHGTGMRPRPSTDFPGVCPRNNRL